MDRSSDFPLEDTYRWLKTKFPGLQSNDDLVRGITEGLVRAYQNGREDGRLAVSAEVQEDLEGLYP